MARRLLTRRYTSWWAIRIFLRLLLGSRLVSLLYIFKVVIVSEVVVKFRIDNRFNKSSGVVSKLLKDLNNNIHHYRSQRWESHENSVDDLSSQLLELSVAIIKTINCWLSKLLELRLQKIVENID